MVRVCTNQEGVSALEGFSRSGTLRPGGGFYHFPLNLGHMQVENEDEVGWFVGKRTMAGVLVVAGLYDQLS